MSPPNLPAMLPPVFFTVYDHDSKRALKRFLLRCTQCPPCRLLAAGRKPVSSRTLCVLLLFAFATKHQNDILAPLEQCDCRRAIRGVRKCTGRPM